MKYGGRVADKLCTHSILVCAVASLLAGGVRNASGQAWMTYARSAAHTAESSVPSQLPQKIRWSTPVDLSPQYGWNGSLFTHYGSPVITSKNTVIIPVKTQAYGGFKVEARNGLEGKLLWSVASDYTLPNGYQWTPPYGPTLVPNDVRAAFPAAGGTVLLRTNPDGVRGNLSRVSFYGISDYLRNPTIFNSAIQICTQITADSAGNLYFGYLSSGIALPGYPNGIPSGLARIGADGSGRFVAARTLSGNADYGRIALNCTPAVSNDGSSVYVGVNKSYTSDGYLCRVDAVNLTPISRVYLLDPSTGTGASINGSGTSSPTIGPDGDVYYGVLESGFPRHNARGWMLHFSNDLVTSKIPGSFGWDDTPSIVPATAVGTYKGTSSYLILTKYNNYAGVNSGDGQNKLAVLDPNATQADPIFSSVSVMKEVITMLGPTPFSGGGVTEWCINTGAVDAANHCAFVNSEDGHCYRWNFDTNTLSPGLKVAQPIGEAYTPTMIGPDGAAYCINNAVLNCCVAKPQASSASSTETPEQTSADSDVSPPIGHQIKSNGREEGPAVAPTRARTINR